MLSKEYILEKIKENCVLDNCLCEGTFYENVVEPLQDCGCFDRFSYDTGASKGVLIFSDLDYVIKIPFYCEYLEEDDYEYDEETGEAYWTGESGPAEYPFNGVGVDGYTHRNHWDYCETEAARYAIAEENGVKNFFAKTWLIGEVNGFPVYAQEKAIMFSSYEGYNQRSQKHYSKEQRETARKIRSEKSFYIEETWVMDFIEYWGQAEMEELIAFCDKYFIDDLHDGNIGYINGAPCIVDYSSYNC